MQLPQLPRFILMQVVLLFLSKLLISKEAESGLTASIATP